MVVVFAAFQFKPLKYRCFDINKPPVIMATDENEQKSRCISKLRILQRMKSWGHIFVYIRNICDICRVKEINSTTCLLKPTVKT